MFDRLLKLFTSLRLTVILLAFSIVLVFVGTVAQADEGLYNAQARYFKHWWVWCVRVFGPRVPARVPGGYLHGTLLLLTLVLAHIKLFQLTTKKTAPQLHHGGVILLLAAHLTPHNRKSTLLNPNHSQ